MNKKLIKSLSVVLSCVLVGTAFSACDDGNWDDTEDAAFVYCSEFYDCSDGSSGGFTIASTGSELAFETNFSDLTKYTLSDAFEGMTVIGAYYSDESNTVSFSLSGELAQGDYGKISGNGIVKGKEIEVSVPIGQAYATSSSVIYSNMESQQIEIDLISACFNKNVKPEDFTLGGAAEGMTITAVSAEPIVDEDCDEELLNQTATLTLSGQIGFDTNAYITISSNATTYNKDLSVVLDTQTYGGVIVNDAIETNDLTEDVYVQAKNITFNSTINKDDVTLSGALQGYAQITSVEVVNESLVTVHLSFPYTYFRETEEDEDGAIIQKSDIGVLSFSADTNKEGVSFQCSACVREPLITFTVSMEGDDVTIYMGLENGEFNLFDFYAFTLLNEEGKEVYVTNTDIVNIDDELTIKFTLPEDYLGFLTFVLEDAYEITTVDGVKKNITVQTLLYIGLVDADD